MQVSEELLEKQDKLKGILLKMEKYEHYKSCAIVRDIIKERMSDSKPL